MESPRTESGIHSARRAITALVRAGIVLELEGGGWQIADPALLVYLVGLTF